MRSIFDNFEMACTDVDSCNRTRNLREALEIFLEPAMVRKSVAISAGWHIRLADHVDSLLVIFCLRPSLKDDIICTMPKKTEILRAQNGNS